ncbi:hypothetical protein PanWU01x14_001080, partial [Parasponia andersonii]
QYERPNETVRSKRGENKIPFQGEKDNIQKKKQAKTKSSFKEINTMYKKRKKEGKTNDSSKNGYLFFFPSTTVLLTKLVHPTKKGCPKPEVQLANQVYIR